MKETRRSVALALGLGLVATTAFAQSGDKVRIGLIQTLSGPAATLGQQARDGFNLAVKELGGKLGGRDA
ncbi:MAG: ABC transporter substrate-binding protein, partial [Microvirga sp.]